jgi:hypothetical protein
VRGRCRAARHRAGSKVGLVADVVPPRWCGGSVRGVAGLEGNASRGEGGARRGLRPSSRGCVVRARALPGRKAPRRIEGGARRGLRPSSLGCVVRARALPDPGARSDRRGRNPHPKAVGATTGEGLSSELVAPRRSASHEEPKANEEAFRKGNGPRDPPPAGRLVSAADREEEGLPPGRSLTSDRPVRRG